MKKMNQVFDDMPLHIDGITCMMDIYQQSNPDDPHQVVAKHAAHAINHVDALADALQNLLDVVGKKPGSLQVEDFLAVDAGLLAIQNYRGEE